VKICNTPECRRMRALLSDFIDHTLHWRTARSLEAHLVACPPCRCYVATIETTIVLYRKRPVVDVPVAVRGHLRAVLRERHESAPKKRAGCRCVEKAVAKPVVPRAKSANKPVR
jgi:anti-sigma factor RsiW